MGNGRYLKELLDKNNMSALQLAKSCNIAPTTLYSMINRNSVIRYDFAVKIANVLNIPVNEICGEIPDSNYEEKIEKILRNRLEFNSENEKEISKVKIWLECEWQCNMIDTEEYNSLLIKVEEIAERLTKLF